LSVVLRYLAIFDDAKPVALFHTKLLASAAQRIMLQVPA
jgi:hypothetical protein